MSPELRPMQSTHGRVCRQRPQKSRTRACEASLTKPRQRGSRVGCGATTFDCERRDSGSLKHGAEGALRLRSGQATDAWVSGPHAEHTRTNSLEPRVSAASSRRTEGAVPRTGTAGPGSRSSLESPELATSQVVSRLRDRRDLRGSHHQLLMSCSARTPERIDTSHVVTHRAAAPR